MNIFKGLQKINTAFFDGLKKNSVNRVLAEAKKQGMPEEVEKSMNKIRKEKDDIDKLLEKIAKL